MEMGAPEASGSSLVQIHLRRSLEDRGVRTALASLRVGQASTWLEGDSTEGPGEVGGERRLALGSGAHLTVPGWRRGPGRRPRTDSDR